MIDLYTYVIITPTQRSSHVGCRNLGLRVLRNRLKHTTNILNIFQKFQRENLILRKIFTKCISRTSLNFYNDDVTNILAYLQFLLLLYIFM